jgi:hypothetical protein
VTAAYSATELKLIDEAIRNAHVANPSMAVVLSDEFLDDEAPALTDDHLTSYAADKQIELERGGNSAPSSFRRTSSLPVSLPASARTLLTSSGRNTNSRQASKAETACTRFALASAPSPLPWPPIRGRQGLLDEPANGFRAAWEIILLAAPRIDRFEQGFLQPDLDGNALACGRPSPFSIFRLRNI